MSGLFRHGARFRFDLSDSDAASATYRAQILLPDGTGFGYRLLVTRADGGHSLDSHGEAALAGGADGPPAWMHAALAALAGRLAKSGSKAERWPRKQQFWKAAPLSDD